MIENLPNYISVVFLVTTLATLFFLFYAIKNSRDQWTVQNRKVFFLCLTTWLLIQSMLTLNNFYKDTSGFPPRFLLMVFPPLLTILILFATRGGRRFIDGLRIIHLTYLHIVRIPVELVLYWLFLHKAVPELMTFAGRNFDILAGVTAPFVAYFGFNRGKLNRKIIFIWNFIALALLINIVLNAVLSAPFRFQQFAFDQPNIAVLNFPFVWLPSFIVPVVLFSHLVSIRQLLASGKN